MTRGAGVSNFRSPRAISDWTKIIGNSSDISERLPTTALVFLIVQQMAALCSSPEVPDLVVPVLLFQISFGVWRLCRL